MGEGTEGPGQPPTEPTFSTSRFAFVVQVIEGESYPAEKRGRSWADELVEAVDMEELAFSLVRIDRRPEKANVRPAHTAPLRMPLYVGMENSAA